MTIRRFDATPWIDDGEARVMFEVSPSGAWVSYDDHAAALAAMTERAERAEKERDAHAEAVRVLAAECEMSRVCVEPDPIYGWDEPRHLADYCMDWRELGKMREQTNANPIAAAAVKGGEG